MVLYSAPRLVHTFAIRHISLPFATSTGLRGPQVLLLRGDLCYFAAMFDQIRFFSFSAAVAIAFSIVGCAGDSSAPATSDAQGSSAEVFAKGKGIFDAQCATCHGANAGGMQALNAPALAGQEQWYLQRQLRHFQNGVRGADPAHVPGTQMAAIAKTLTSPTDVMAVAQYIAALPVVQHTATIQGDPIVGKAQFNTVCTACHGNKADGIAALHSPRLSGLNDWYVAAQMDQFIHGSRGTHAADTFGQQMKPMAMTVTDAQTINDIAAYLQSIDNTAAQ